MQSENQCIICKASFRESALKDGKCPDCAVKFPSAKTREDIMKKGEKNKTRNLTENVVEQIVYEILEEAGIKRHRCDKCSALFFRTSPAQKQCLKCKEEEAK